MEMINSCHFSPGTPLIGRIQIFQRCNQRRSSTQFPEIPFLPGLSRDLKNHYKTPHTAGFHVFAENAPPPLPRQRASRDPVEPMAGIRCQSTSVRPFITRHSQVPTFKTPGLSLKLADYWPKVT